MQRSLLAFTLMGIAVALAAEGPGTALPGYTAIGRFEPQPPGAPAATPQDLRDRFQAALADAAKSDPARISRNLMSITGDNLSLTWKGVDAGRQVLTLVYTGYTGYDPLVGQTTSLTRDVWVVIPAELKNFCATHDIPQPGLRLRLEQLFGLTPNGGRTRLVEIWASPDDLFRPSPDPEITDHEAELDFPVSTRYLTVSSDHIQWINDLKAISYLPTGMPWTRLGYTYDWGNPASILGLSEFVIRQGASVEIQSVNAPEDYCRPSSAAAPAFTASDVVNLASGLGGAVAPGEHLSLTGLRLGARAYFDADPASIAYASPTELQLLVPDQVQGRTRTALTVESQGVRSNPVWLPVVSAHPGIFTAGGMGPGIAVAVNEDGFFNADQHPAAPGSILSFWATGLGTTLHTAAAFPRPALGVRADFGGATWPAEIRFAGMTFPGVAQINVRIPDDVPRNGWADLYLTAGQSTTRAGVRVRIK